MKHAFRRPPVSSGLFCIGLLLVFTAALAILLASCKDKDGTSEDKDNGQAMEPLPERLLDPTQDLPPRVAIPEIPSESLSPSPEDTYEPPVLTPEARHEVGTIEALAKDVVDGKVDISKVVSRLPDGRIKVGNVTVDLEKGEMTLPGWINQVDGIIEYMAVGPRGKTHESVLVFDVEGLHLQLGCILLGLTPAPLPKQTDPAALVVREGRKEPDPAPPKADAGSLVDIFVEWETKDHSSRRCRAEELAWNREKKRTMKRARWVFTGSVVWNGHFVAQYEQSYVATWPDRGAIFNTPLPSRNPYRGVTFGYEANRKVLPPVGTNVLIHIKKIENAN